MCRLLAQISVIIFFISGASEWFVRWYNAIPFMSTVIGTKPLFRKSSINTAWTRTWGRFKYINTTSLDRESLSVLQTLIGKKLTTRSKLKQAQSQTKSIGFCISISLNRHRQSQYRNSTVKKLIAFERYQICVKRVPVKR